VTTPHTATTFTCSGLPAITNFYQYHLCRIHDVINGTYMDSWIASMNNTGVVVLGRAVPVAPDALSELYILSGLIPPSEITAHIDTNSTQLAAIVADTNELQADGFRTDIDSILADTNELELDWKNGGRLDLLIDSILADTNELQAMFDDVDSTGTEVITAAKATEIILAILGGNALYDSTTRVWTIYGRDETTVLWTVKLSNTVKGNRTDSTLV